MGKAGLDSDSTYFIIAAIATLIIHALLAVMLATAGEDAVEVAPSGVAQLCDDIRCSENPVKKRRRNLDNTSELDVGMIEASIIPMLGMADAKPGTFPKLVKYEQPEKIEEAVNITKTPTSRDKPPVQDVRAKKAEVDRKRKDTLTDILGAPEDDDPRKRPTELSRIVGSPDGSVHGSGTEFKAGNIYAGKVSLALREQFTVPPFLSDADLKKLKVRIKVTKINSSGQILGYQVVQRSSDNRFNAAAVQAVKRFSPKDGGSAYLPAPDEATLVFINQRGMVIDLDGSLFKR